VLDLGSLRFAVPESWVVQWPGACMDPPPRDLVVLSFTPDPQPLCLQEANGLRNGVFVELDAPGTGGEPVMLGTRSARRVPSTAPGTTYAFTTEERLSIVGPDSDAVLATVTDGSARRALQDGPVASTKGWRSVTYAGVRFKVPSDWPSVDLPSSVHQYGRGALSFQADPGACGPPMFAIGTADKVFLGSSGYVPSCPAAFSLELGRSGAGAWIRPVTPREGALGLIVPSGDQAGVEVGFVRGQRVAGGVGTLQLSVRRGTTQLLLSIGVGRDVPTARAILRSITPD
jgi:hypothetical protein